MIERWEEKDREVEMHTPYRQRQRWLQEVFRQKRTRKFKEGKEVEGLNRKQY